MNREYEIAGFVQFTCFVCSGNLFPKFELGIRREVFSSFGRFLQSFTNLVRN